MGLPGARMKSFTPENARESFSNPEQEILGRINRLLSFDTTWTPQKTTPPIILRFRGNVFTELLPNNDRMHNWSLRSQCKGQQLRPPLIYLCMYVCRNNRGIHRHTPPILLLLLRLFSAAGTCLRNHCLAMKEEYTLPSFCLATIQTHRLVGDLWRTPLRWYTCTKCHKDYFRHSKVNWRDSQTDSIEESRLKIN
jgi:hypothetical protein